MTWPWSTAVLAKLKTELPAGASHGSIFDGGRGVELA